jgi:hypothetical protein
MKVAAVLAWIAGFDFGLPCIYAIWYFADPLRGARKCARSSSR